MGKARVKRWQLERAKHRKLLWVAFGVMQSAFVLEVGAGLAASSASLQIDALETAETKTLSDSVITPRWSGTRGRRLEQIAGTLALAFCAWTVAVAIWNHVHDILPNAVIMAAASGLIFAVNALVFALLYGERVGSPKMRAAWTGARNDMIGAGIVLCAAGGVWITKACWPDAAALAVLLPFAARRAILTMRAPADAILTRRLNASPKRAPPSQTDGRS